MKKKRALFFCESIYQLLNAVNIKKNMLSSEWSADVVMNDHNDFSEIVPRLRECSIFDGIYPIAEHWYYKNKGSVFTYVPSVNLAVNRIFSGFILWKRYRLVLNERYDAFFTSDLNDIAANAIYGHLSGKNPRLKLYQYEDGFATYERPRYMSNSVNKLQKILCRIIGKKILCADDVKYTLLYKPELCNRQDIALRQIPQLKLKDRELYNYIFGYDNTVINQKYLLFNQSFYVNGVDYGERGLFLSVMETVGESNTIVKLHPRSPRGLYDERLIMNASQNVPWEVCMMNQNMDDKVLVTLYSSCVFTSKMLFSSKCKVLLLFGIPGGYLNRHYKSWNELIDRFQAEYGSDVLIPRSKEELADMLNELNSEGRQ